MTRQEFIDRHKHELVGVVIDGMVAERKGGESALFVRTVMHRYDRLLGAIYDDFHTAAKPPAAPPAKQEGKKT
jgi:hypothetical protein